MTNGDILDRLSERFRQHFGAAHAAGAYAPGRMEVLGNHTDYNEGFVLSAAINLGTFFLCAPSASSACRLVAADVGQEVTFDAASPSPSREPMWANYVKGVFAKLAVRGRPRAGFNGMLLGNIPLGSGLSSSAALEVSSGLALAHLYGLRIDPIEMARIGQAAEHEYVGAKCGLLDQISSLYGKRNALVMTDFRSIDVRAVPLGSDTAFLTCNTRVKHTLVESAYNERRHQCEAAARFFASVLEHPVTALRDVSWDEWKAHASRLEPVTARRAAHVIGENERVLKGRECLANARLNEFGKLMFESHESSRIYFENSCPELDFLVEEASRIPGPLGARLSGGGFGGSVIVLLHPKDADAVAASLSAAYEKRFGHPCEIRLVTPSDGATALGGNQR